MTSRILLLFSLLLLSAGVLSACRRADERLTSPPEVATAAAVGGEQQILNEMVGFEWELPENTFISVMDEGVLAITFGFRDPLEVVEPMVVEKLTSEGYIIDESAGDPVVDRWLRSYIFVRDDKRLDVVLQDSQSGEDSTSITILEQ